MLLPCLAKADSLEEQKKWLSGEIYGSDNDMAALRRVEIAGGLEKLQGIHL